MKTRIKGNSIRLRLTKSEVDTFSTQDYIEEVTSFGKGLDLISALQVKKQGEGLSAEFFNNKITMFIPESQKNEWVSTDLVGLSYRMDIGDGRQLALLLEKDWVCLDNTMEEDQSDNYPNPNVNC